MEGKMIIMEADATPEQIERVVTEIKKHGLNIDIAQGSNKTIIGAVGDKKKLPYSELAAFPGVEKANVANMPYKLINRQYSDVLQRTDECLQIKIGNVVVGDNEPVFIAGPCAIESRDQIFRIAEEVKEAGAHILRGGIFKPRSSVHSFQGIGGKDRVKAEEALNWLCQAGNQFEMPVITEIRGESQVDLVAEYADILQIGSRNMYDQDLLTTVARKQKPVFLKRHFGAGIEEFLSFAEYIAAEGNKSIILCERGIVPVGKGRDYTRYILDLASVPAIRKETYLPIMVDPSHATGRRDLVYSMGCAAIAAGASGLMLEVHYNPEEAIVDGDQTITPGELKNVIESCQRINQLLRN